MRESRTQPTSDQVPELMNAQSSPWAGIPAMADAVSWHAGAINRVSRKAGREARSPCSRPISRSRFHQRRRGVRIQSRRCEDFSAPGLVLHVQQLGVAWHSCIRKLALRPDSASTNSGRFTQGRLLFGWRISAQLIERVQGKDLNSGQCVKAIGRNSSDAPALRRRPCVRRGSRRDRPPAFRPAPKRT